MERLTEKQLHILRQKLCDMKNRCYNPQNKFYKDYGGRGISVCDEWSGKDGHKNFQKWALENGWKEGCSIDRIDVNGDYEPSNCRWATPKEQANNRRNNCPVTIHGVTKNATEWAEEIGISQRSFISRIKCGWDEDRLLEPKYKPLKMTKAEMSKEIREWRNAEEQGLLLKLPCKVGDTVYNIVPHLSLEGTYAEGSTYNEDVVSYIQINEDSILLVFKNGLAKNINQIGITVFLTQAEVEKALEERIANKELWKKA